MAGLPGEPMQTGSPMKAPPEPPPNRSRAASPAGAALEGRFAEAVRGEIAQLRTARLALLVEACGATGFPSSGEGPLRAALSAAFASRTLSLQEAADSGLRLALAGVSDAAVYDAMAAAATAAAEEGQRWQPRWLVGAVARLALCGIVVPALCVSCAAALGQGGQDEGRESRAVKEMAAGSFSFFSELPLVYLHLKGTHVHKMAHAPSGACEVPASAGAWAGPGGFADPCRPLVVDLGCGRGAWLLQMLAEDGPAARAGWNGLGVDTMPRLLAYPRGLSCRWGQHGRLRFALGGAEEALRRLASYPGPVVLVGLHFPTPYAAEGGSPERRNAQLPALEDFIVGSGMEEALCRLGGSSSLPRTPLVFVQSATEEVAVTVRRLLEKGGGLEAVAGAALAAHAAVRPLAPAADPTAAAAAPTAPPAGCGRRGSAGPEEEHGGWLPSSPFSPTETEALLAASGRSVWRLALAPRAEACRSGASEGF